MTNKINVMGYTYTVDLSQKLDDMHGNVGYCDFDKKTLQVANDVDTDVIESTLLHEIIEAINYHLELNLEHPQIMGLEVCLHQILVDNGVPLLNLYKKY